MRMNYLNAQNTFQQSFTTCIAVHCHLSNTVNKHVVVKYKAQSFTATSSMDALPHRKSASTGASRDNCSAQDSNKRDAK
jgi:hypothetical protein